MGPSAAVHDGDRRTAVATRRAPDPATAIALLCARERVDLDPDGGATPERVARLRALCAVVEDWDALLLRCSELLVLPLVHAHLRAHAADVVPAEALAALQAAARRRVLRNLQAAEVHLRVEREVLAPLGVPHVFLKGTTLAHRFHREPSLRVARDVDVLVPRTALERIGHAVRALGFRPLHAGMGSDDAIRYAAAVLGEVDWRSPEGILVEFHSTLSMQEGRLPTERLLAAPEHVVVAGVPLPTLSLHDTVAHLCLHHTRSGWTHLHCVSDLDALLRSSGVDPDTLIAEARARGFARVVAAALGMHRVLAAVDPWEAAQAQVAGAADEHARDVARIVGLCLDGLVSGRSAPGQRIPRAMRAHAVRAASVDLGRVARARVRLRSALRPLTRQSADFVRLPLPPRWHGAYLVLRPLLRLVGGPVRA